MADSSPQTPAPATAARVAQQGITAPLQLTARLIAFYLPQFYPIPENDRWWGRGFTEWTSVARTKPLFRGHDQPRVPTDLGFYDLRLPETQAAQAQLASDHGIEAFCYWHYWFGGRRLLERPFEEVLRSGGPEFGFCLAWANDEWRRTWIGQGEVLQPQPYSAEDDRNHARWLCRAFGDPRYTTVDRRPILLVYKPLDLPDPHQTTDTLRDECVRQGLQEPYLLGINAFCFNTDLRDFGFDGTLEFEPQLGALGHTSARGPIVSRAKLRRNLRLGIVSARLDIFDYEEARTLMRRQRAGRDFPFYPTVLVSWDNTPRRGRAAIVMVNSTPERLEAAVRDCVRELAPKPFEDRLVFLNAWNEWGEGNYLEPDLSSGRRRLEAVRRAVSSDLGGAPRRSDRAWPSRRTPPVRG